MSYLRQEFWAQPVDAVRPRDDVLRVVEEVGYVTHCAPGVFHLDGTSEARNDDAPGLGQEKVFRLDASMNNALEGTR